MPKMEYPFTANIIPTTSSQPARIAYRPQRAATITAPNGEAVRFLVLLDSGADACLFPMSTAILLGIDVLSLPRAFTGGVGSQANLTYYQVVTIDLGDGIAFQTIAGFTAGLDAVGFGLLGLIGFFENFNVEFRYRERLFTIEPAV